MKRDGFAGFKAGVWLTFGVVGVARTHEMAGRPAFWIYLDSPVAVTVFASIALLLGGAWSIQAIRQERRSAMKTEGSP